MEKRTAGQGFSRTGSGQSLERSNICGNAKRSVQWPSGDVAGRKSNSAASVTLFPSPPHERKATMPHSLIPHNASPPVPRERGVHIDDTGDPTHVIASIVTACGHVVETARIERTWWKLREVAGTTVEAELRLSLAKRCTPWAESDRCAHCPFPPELRVIRCQPDGG